MRTQYLKTDDGVSIAYQDSGGDGPAFVYVPGAISNLTLENRVPEFARFYEQLGRFTRLLRFDKRGTGLSDPLQEPPTMERYVADVVALLDAVGADRVFALGNSHGGTIATSLALAHPERVDGLVLMNALCCDEADALADGAGESFAGRYIDWTERDYEDFVQFAARAVVVGDRPESAAFAAGFIEASSSPHTWRLAFRGLVGLDMRPRLAEIAIPALVLHSVGDALVPVSHGRAYARGIPNATYLELDSDSHVPLNDGRVAPLMLSAIEQLVTGQVRHAAERVVTSVLFTDIVDSTARQQAVGDAEWRRVRERFEDDSRRWIEQFGGRVVQFTGDGVMAAFPSPSQALRSARALVEGARTVGVEIRAGLHAGEAYEVEDQLFGTCVTVAARVAAQAGAGEIWTTPIVSGLVEGSGFAFEDVRDAELKGIGRRRLIRLK